MTHLLSFLVLLGKLRRSGSCAGVSAHTQVLYFTVFCLRYLDVLLAALRFVFPLLGLWWRTPYLTTMKVAYLGLSAWTLWTMYRASSVTP